MVDGILLEDTFYQDNQYARVNSCLLVAEPLPRASPLAPCASPCPS